MNLLAFGRPEIVGELSDYTSFRCGIAGIFNRPLMCCHLRLSIVNSGLFCALWEGWQYPNLS